MKPTLAKPMIIMAQVDGSGRQTKSRNKERIDYCKEQREFARVKMKFLKGRKSKGEIGPELFHRACLMGLEGLASKHRASPYRGGRFARWVKVENRKHPAFNRVMDQLG